MYAHPPPLHCFSMESKCFLAVPDPFEGLESWRVQAMPLVNQPAAYRAVLSDPAFRAKVSAEIYGEHPSGLTALLAHDDWGNMMVATPADGDEALTGRRHIASCLAFILNFELKLSLGCMGRCGG